MLFFLYLMSVAISVVVMYRTTISFSKKMEKDGFLFVEKESLWEYFKEHFILVFKVCFPVINIINVLCLFFCMENVYQKMVTCFFIGGKIIFDENRLKKTAIPKQTSQAC